MHWHDAHGWAVVLHFSHKYSDARVGRVRWATHRDTKLAAAFVHCDVTSATLRFGVGCHHVIRGLLLRIVCRRTGRWWWWRAGCGCRLTQAETCIFLLQRRLVMRHQSRDVREHFAVIERLELPLTSLGCRLGNFKVFDFVFVAKGGNRVRAISTRRETDQKCTWRRIA